MPNTKGQENFQEWMRKQIRLAGEELIRRSENLNLGGLDAMQDMSITIRIPTYKDELDMMNITFGFQVANMKATNDLIYGGDEAPQNES